MTCRINSVVDGSSYVYVSFITADVPSGVSMWLLEYLYALCSSYVLLGLSLRHRVLALTRGIMASSRILGYVMFRRSGVCARIAHMWDYRGVRD